MRSEFDEAEKHLAQLIAHTRTYRIFPYFSARITLHHAHLAHALGQTTRALQCYDVAAKLSAPNSFVNTSARAGRILLKVGMDTWDEEIEKTEMQYVVNACKGLGGTLEAVGHVVEACLSAEIMKSKYVFLPLKLHICASLDVILIMCTSAFPGNTSKKLSTS